MYRSCPFECQPINTQTNRCITPSASIETETLHMEVDVVAVMDDESMGSGEGAMQNTMAAGDAGQHAIQENGISSFVRATLISGCNTLNFVFLPTHCGWQIIQTCAQGAVDCHSAAVQIALRGPRQRSLNFWQSHIYGGQSGYGYSRVTNTVTAPQRVGQAWTRRCVGQSRAVVALTGPTNTPLRGTNKDIHWLPVKPPSQACHSLISSIV